MKRAKPPQNTLQASPPLSSSLVAIIIMKEMPGPIPRAQNLCKGGGAGGIFFPCATPNEERNKSPGLVVWVKRLCGSASCRHGPFAMGGLFNTPSETPYAQRCIGDPEVITQCCISQIGLYPAICATPNEDCTDSVSIPCHTA